MPAVAEPNLESLASECGVPLAAYRAEHVARCVDRALVRTGTASPAELTRRLRDDPRAREAFRRSVLVAVTGMFRDAEEFHRLEQSVVPRLLAERGRLDVWSAGCAHGEELHSVAVILDRAGALGQSSMLGSDVHTEALEHAAATVGELSCDLRAVAQFERRDLILEPAPTRRFDLVLCRNVLIYLERGAQDELRRKLIDALRPGGYLMLGRSEVLVSPRALGLERVSRHFFRKPRP